MAQFGVSEDVLRKTFNELREFRDELQKEFSIALPELSMGMSDDYLEAIKAGSTFVRLGRILWM